MKNNENNNEKTPFYQDKNFYFMAIGFTLFGYYGIPLLKNLYKNYRNQ